ncbi:MAG: dihydrofolate reductase family protein [Chloroflexi bacterium]|nr:dihydrofolate reductase family protein [Chloroflexota bacterium]
MRNVIYSMNVSLDGYVEDASGSLDWALVDEEIHQFFNDQEQSFDVTLYGRRLYETMHPYWSTAEQEPDLREVEKEYARIWNSIPKIVFSRTLDHVEGNATLKRDGLIEEVTRLRAEPGGSISVGGPTLAAGLIEAGLIDEFRPVIHPVVLGGGKPFLPSLDTPIKLKLLESRRFASGATYLRYARAD